jgi:hypothetical protein
MAALVGRLCCRAPSTIRRFHTRSTRSSPPLSSGRDRNRDSLPLQITD